jgi:hypothetical protein
MNRRTFVFIYRNLIVLRVLILNIEQKMDKYYQELFDAIVLSRNASRQQQLKGKEIGSRSAASVGGENKAKLLLTFYSINVDKEIKETKE